ncbi:unnamed protein product [Symbiodinium sp. KB8]|nr:unnamed protein product [Symbiodinium sp. KB8]
MQTQWPWDITGRGDTNDAQQPEIADFFLSLNERRIAAAPPAARDALKRAEVVAEEAKQAQLDGKVLPPLPKTKDDDEIFVVTMSHFVPRQECYPGPRRLCGVMGCREIEEQARACGSRCHIFGHSHISCDRQVEGVRYVQHPLGYPNDYHRQGEPKPVWGGCKSRQEAPNLTEEPASKLAKNIVKAILDDIRDCPEKCMERPPGRWSKEDGDNYSSHNIFDRKEEMKLRESMGYDAKKMAELWSAPPPVRELEVEVTYFQHGDQRLTLNLPNNLLVRQLKERLVEEVGRGNPAKIVVSTSGENALNDDVALSSIESEITGGLIVMGIDMSKGKSVTVKLVHAASDVPQSLTISVLDTATMLDVRKEAMIRLGETSISNCKVVKRLATGGFQGLADGDRLNAKRELLFLGRDLPDSPSAQETKRPPPKTQKVTANKCTAKKADLPAPEVPAAQTAKRPPKSEPSGERLGRDQPPREMHLKITSLLDPDQQLEMAVASDFLVRELKELIVAELGHGDPSKILLSSTGDDVLRDERPLGTYEREVSGGLVLIGMDLKRPQESKPKEIKVKLVHATQAEQSLVLLVPEKSTILQLRKEVMQRVGEKSLANAKIVRRSGGGFVSFPDTEKLEGPRELLFLGCSLPSLTSAETKELSLKQLLMLLEDIHDAVEKEPFQKNVLRMKAEFHSDMGKAKALLGPVFAAACADPLRKQGIALSKKGFDAMFAQIWQHRGQPGIVAATAEIEGNDCAEQRASRSRVCLHLVRSASKYMHVDLLAADRDQGREFRAAEFRLPSVLLVNPVVTGILKRWCFPVRGNSHATRANLAKEHDHGAWDCRKGIWLVAGVPEDHVSLWPRKRLAQKGELGRTLVFQGRKKSAFLKGDPHISRELYITRANDKHGKCFCDAGTKPMEADHLHKTLRSMSPSFLECLFMAVIRTCGSISPMAPIQQCSLLCLLRRLKLVTACAGTLFEATKRFAERAAVGGIVDNQLVMKMLALMAKMNFKHAADIRALQPVAFRTCCTPSSAVAVVAAKAASQAYSDQVQGTGKDYGQGGFEKYGRAPKGLRFKRWSHSAVKKKSHSHLLPASLPDSKATMTGQATSHPVEDVGDEEESDDEDEAEKESAKRNRHVVVTSQGIGNSTRSDEGDGSDESDEGVQHAENAAALLENDVSTMLTRDKTQAGVERSDLERTLEKLGFNVAEEDEHLKGSSNPVGWNRQGGSGSGEKEFGQEKELMLALFPARKKTYKLQPQHLGLPAVLRHVFVAQEELLKRSAGGMVESSSMRVAMKKAEAWLRTRLCGPRAFKVSRSLQSITNKKPFIVFFFLLTVYILVFPDLIQILTDSDADKTLLTANTIVFFLFLFELILIVSVEGSYILSIPFVLDAVSLVSIFADTWFMAEIAVDTKSSSLTKLARSSRIARIARIGRVARVTKLIPRVLKLCRKQSNALAEQLLLRRLWRLFQYLDTARDGKLSVFDLKIFYLALLQECPHVRPDKSDVVKMLEKDSELLLSCGQDESGHVNELKPSLSVDVFSEILMQTKLGVHLVEFHRQDLESDGGSVWALTQRLSDSTAMKVCVGILALVATMSLLEVDIVDYAPSHGLTQLDKIAREVHAQDTEEAHVLHKRIVDYIIANRHVVKQCCEALGSEASDAGPLDDVIEDIRALMRQTFPEVSQCGGVGMDTNAVVWAWTPSYKLSCCIVGPKQSTTPTRIIYINGSSHRGLHEGWAEDYHGNYTSVDDDPAAKAEVNRLLESGYVKCFESRGAGEAWVGGKVCLSKLGLITKVHPITGKVKCRLILDCKQSHVNQRAWKGGRLLLPRVTDVLDDTLGLLRQAEGTDSGVEWLVLDYSDWFFQIPLHPKERRHVAFAYKAKGKFAVYTVQAQGSLNAPVVCGRVAALVARLTQGAFGESALKLQIYVDDPCIGVCGSNAQRDVNLSALILMWRASSVAASTASVQQDCMPTGKFTYSSLFLVRCLLMNRLLPAYVPWKQLCVDAITLLFPNLLRDAVPRLLENKHLFPGEGSKHKIRLILDVALLLWQRKKGEREGKCVRFAGADSSPQHGKNWLLSACVSVRQDKIVEVFHCLQRMIFDCQRRSCDYDPELQSEQSRADHKTVHSHVQQQHELPVVLGSGAETTGHKCAAMLHKWTVLVGHSDKLQDHLGSFFSFCSDMGVELGIGHYHVQDFMSLLPPWLQHSSMEVDLPDNAALPGNAQQFNFESDLQEVPGPQPEVAEVGAPDAAQEQDNLDSVANWKWQPQPRQDPSSSSSLFLPNAITVAGLLHIVNNALVEVSGQLAHFDAFFEQLGEFEGLVTCGRLVRFVNYCVRPSHLAHQADDLLQRKFGRLYLKRWGEVVKFCKRLSEFLPLIRCVWDQRAYLHGAAAEEEGGRNATRFSPERLSNILKDHMFFAYFDMVLKLSDAIEQLAHWAESCPCHEDFQMQPDLRAFNRRGRRDAQAHFRHGVRAVRSMYQGRCETCVMRGKRLPELVAEGLDFMLARLSDLAYVQLLQAHRPLLSDAEWASVVSDLEKGKAHAQLEFSLKLDFLRRLPWKLALLAHHDQAKARRELQVTVREFDAQTPELQQHHHSLVCHMLGRSGQVRADFDKYLAGQSLNDLPKLEFYAACFRLVQVTERSYEASHSIVKRKVPPNAAGPIVSLSLRLHDFARAVQMQESVLQEVASEFELARQVLRLPGLVGLAAHPDILRHRKHQWSVVKHMNRVLYRADAVSQFPEVSHLDAFDKKDKDRQQRVAQKLMPSPEDLDLTYDNLRAKALHAHFLGVAEACPQAMFALPDRVANGAAAGVPFLHPIEARLAISDLTTEVANLCSDLPLPLPMDPPLDEVPPRPDPEKHLFFRVLRAQPSRRRTMSLAPAAAGKRGRLHANDVAVSVHDQLSAADASSSSWLALTPGTSEGGSSAQVLANLPLFMSYSDMSKDLVCSDFQSQSEGRGRKADLKYSFSLPVSGALAGDLERGSVQMLSDIATCMVTANSFPGSDCWRVLPASDEVRLLCEVGFIVQKAPEPGNGGNPEGSYQLGHAGLEALRMYASFSDFEPVARLTHDALQLPEPSAHELLQLMEDQGWVWQRFPSKRKRDAQAEALAYDIGTGAKIFHTSTLSVAPAYLKCLLSAEELKAKYGIQRIPHGHKTACYIGLLEGKLPSEAPARAPAPRLALEYDLSDFQEPNPAIAAEAAEANASMADDDAAQLDTSSADRGCEDQDEEAEGGSQCGSEELEQELLRLVEEASVLEPSGNGADLTSVGDGRPGSSTDAPPPPAPPRHNTERALEAARQGESFDWDSFRFGAFKFTAKKPKQQVIQCLKHWCNEARRFDRQRHHVNFTVLPDECPSEALIAAAVIPATAVPFEVLTDEALDKADARRTSAASKAKANPKQKSKAKATAKARGKAKAAASGKGKAKAKAGSHTAPGPGSDEAASDPETSDSGGLPLIGLLNGDSQKVQCHFGWAGWELSGTVLHGAPSAARGTEPLGSGARQKRASWSQNMVLGWELSRDAMSCRMAHALRTRNMQQNRASRTRNTQLHLGRLVLHFTDMEQAAGGCFTDTEYPVSVLLARCPAALSSFFACIGRSCSPILGTMRKGFLLQPTSTKQSAKSKESKPKESKDSVAAADSKAMLKDDVDGEPKLEDRGKSSSDGALEDLGDLGLQKFSFDQDTDISLGFENGKFVVRTKPSEFS